MQSLKLKKNILFVFLDFSPDDVLDLVLTVVPEVVLDVNTGHCKGS